MFDDDSDSEIGYDGGLRSGLVSTSSSMGGRTVHPMYVYEEELDESFQSGYEDAGGQSVQQPSQRLRLSTIGEEEELRDETFNSEFGRVEGNVSDYIRAQELSRQRAIRPDDPRFDLSHHEKENSWEPSPYNSISEPPLPPEARKPTAAEDRDVLSSVDNQESHKSSEAANKDRRVTFSSRSPDRRTLPVQSSSSSAASSPQPEERRHRDVERTPRRASPPGIVARRQLAGQDTTTTTTTASPVADTTTDAHFVSTPTDRSASARALRQSLRDQFGEISDIRAATADQAALEQLQEQNRGEGGREAKTSSGVIGTAKSDGGEGKVLGGFRSLTIRRRAVSLTLSIMV